MKSDSTDELELSQVRATVFTLVGAILGGVVYAVGRAMLPGRLAVGAALVGVTAGLAAKLGGSIGGPAQLRIIVFGSLFATVIGEYVYFGQVTPVPTVALFVEHLLRDPVWLLFVILFLVGGIFFGVRLLVGGDPLGDVLRHGAGAVPPGAHGTPCPRCGSVQTAVADQSLELECNACGHRFRPDPHPDGEPDAAT